VGYEREHELDGSPGVKYQPAGACKTFLTKKSLIKRTFSAPRKLLAQISSKFDAKV
jgi:hypothetical protein